MGNGNLILAKKMAQSIIKDGVVRDMDLFTDISVVLKQASDQDPEAKSLLNRINLIKISNMSQPRRVPHRHLSIPHRLRRKSFRRFSRRWHLNIHRLYRKEFIRRCNPRFNQGTFLRCKQRAPRSNPRS